MMSAAEMAEMVRVLAEAGMCADEIAAACERVAGAGLPIIATSHAGARKRSPGAIRQARYKARKRLQSVTPVTLGDAFGRELAPQVMPETQVAGADLPVLSAQVEASPRVTKRHRGDGRSKKERSPTPPKEKTIPPSPKKGASPQLSPLAMDRVRLHRDDPVFAEIAKLRGLPIQSMQISERDNSWSFPVNEVERARQSRNAREGPDIAGLSRELNHGFEVMK